MNEGKPCKNEPLIPAAFSPCLPNPNPVLKTLDLVSDDGDFSCSFQILETNEGPWLAALEITGRTSTPATCVGRALFACSRQEVTERFDFADSRQMRPTSMLRQPIENRKKAEARVNVSTRWDRIAAPILCENVMNGCHDEIYERRSLQALHESKSANTKIFP